MTDDAAFRDDAARTMERLHRSALWTVNWLRQPEPVVRLREGAPVEDALELVKGLADLATLLATQLGAAQTPALSAEDVLQQIAGATQILSDEP